MIISAHVLHRHRNTQQICEHKKYKINETLQNQINPLKHIQTSSPCLQKRLLKKKKKTIQNNKTQQKPILTSHRAKNPRSAFKRM